MVTNTKVINPYRAPLNNASINIVDVLVGSALPGTKRTFPGGTTSGYKKVTPKIMIKTANESIIAI